MKYANDDKFNRISRGIAVTIPFFRPSRIHKPCFICGITDTAYYFQIVRIDGYLNDTVQIYCVECAPVHMPRFSELKHEIHNNTI